jgi:hypothetical protein
MAGHATVLNIGRRCKISRFQSIRFRLHDILLANEKERYLLFFSNYFKTCYSKEFSEVLSEKKLIP